MSSFSREALERLLEAANHCIALYVKYDKDQDEERDALADEALRIAKGIVDHAPDTVWISGVPTAFPETAVDALIALARKLGASEEQIKKQLPDCI